METFGWNHGGVAPLAEGILAALGEKPAIWYAEPVDSGATKVIWYVGQRGLIRVAANDDFTDLDASLTPWRAIGGWGLTASASTARRMPASVTLRLVQPDLPVTASPRDESSRAFIDAVRDRLDSLE